MNRTNGTGSFAGVICSGFLLVWVAACSSVAPGPVARNAPDWVNRGGGGACAMLYKGQKVLCGEGTVTGINNKGLAIMAVDERARVDLARTLSTVVSGLQKDYGSSLSKGGSITPKTRSSEEQGFENVQKTVTRANLAGSMIADRWLDPSDGTYYALAILDVKSFGDFLQNARELSQEAQKFVKKDINKACRELNKEEEKH